MNAPVPSPVEPSLTPGLGLEDGQAIGRDPRTMTRDELQIVGHERMSPLKALRLRCIDCCAGSAYQVRRCTAVTCPSWPFRMGNSPWREKKVLSDEERAAVSQRMQALRQKQA